MKRKRQPGFFDVAERTAKLTRMGGPLVGWVEPGFSISTNP